ncbi:hypothetical protein PV326_013927 [Microctonus aethiopoides]|nr:hypothetical protein PV326_013927 [Microctonus aethiopoides]
MSSQLVSTKMFTQSNRCIFDVKLDLSYVVDSEQDSLNSFGRSLLTTITDQIGDKHKQGKRCSRAIRDSLLDEFLLLKPSGKEWKGTISVGGQCVDKNSVSAFSEIIYDLFTYDGFTMLDHSTDGDLSYEVFLKYTIRFFQSPILPIAHHMFSARGYSKIYHCPEDIETSGKTTKNPNLNNEKECNDVEILRTNHGTYKRKSTDGGSAHRVLH